MKEEDYRKRYGKAKSSNPRDRSLAHIARLLSAEGWSEDLSLVVKHWMDNHLDSMEVIKADRKRKEEASKEIRQRLTAKERKIIGQWFASARTEGFVCGLMMALVTERGLK